MIHNGQGYSRARGTCNMLGLGLASGLLSYTMDRGILGLEVC